MCSLVVREQNGGLCQEVQMARHCGIPLKDVIHITGSNGRTWPANDSPFSFTEDGTTYFGDQKMKHALPTTVRRHQLGKFYPIAGTKSACTIISMDFDEALPHPQALVSVEYDAQAKIVFPYQKVYPLSKIMLLGDYSSIYGEQKTKHSSDIPKLNNTPPKKKKSVSPKKNPCRGTLTTAIAVGTAEDIYAKLIELSPDATKAVTLAITHEEVGPETLPLRNFETMDDIAQVFYKQGVMDEEEQGYSCGVEAVCNAGFAVRARDFVRVEDEGFVASEFGGDADAQDDYMNNTGGGNNIPTNQMYRTMENLSPILMDQSPHLVATQIGTSAFWWGHHWAIVRIPVCGGHWVSMEKIIYNGQEAICLREGRGNTTYDLMNTSTCLPQRLPPGGAGGGKRKRA